MLENSRLNKITIGTGAFSYGIPPAPNLSQKNAKFLAADIGGTKSHLAIFQLEAGNLLLIKEKRYSTKSYASFNEVLLDFIGKDFLGIEMICLGVAGPVINGKVKGTNFPWVIDARELQRFSGVAKVLIINDMEANAMGLNLMREEDFLEIKPGSKKRGNAGIISPGTGLGEIGLFRQGNHFFTIPTEGGHCDFCPRTEQDVLFWRYLQSKYQRVSWERVLSGPGIFDIYLFLLSGKNSTIPKWFNDRLLTEDPAAIISSGAKEGTCDFCKETLNLFVRYLAIEASLFSLKFLTMGGIFLGGGILPKVASLIRPEFFRDNFLSSDRMNSLLDPIPVRLILNSHSAILGAAYCAAVNTCILKE